MSARGKVRSQKTAIHEALCADYSLILNKVFEKGLITPREYRNLKSINKESVEGHVIELVDKLLDKGEDTCEAFLSLLQTDDDIVKTYPALRTLQLDDRGTLHAPVQDTSVGHSDVRPPPSKKLKKDERYELNSQPSGLCVIINNKNFSKPRRGSDKDAESLGEVFTWLGFRALMCKDQTKDQMERALKCFASQSDLAQLQEFNVEEWTGSKFTALQEAPRHGDALICCILSHGRKGVVLGIDDQPLSIKQIIGTFLPPANTTLTGKPKVFLIQACQGGQAQHGVFEELQADDSPSPTIPKEADVLVAVATVEDYLAFRHITDGSWFIQSVCEQLKDGCPRGEDITTILQRVNWEVGKKEGCSAPGAGKQMPEVRFTLRKKLVLSPHPNCFVAK
uniref:Caspase 20, apoptosis-related cysteine peptidase n=1 Tax=Gasterosteus aculeatus aculeatus TaxID=481459 RepID=G3PHA8_GASAC|nr:caspase-8-like [Gasterosteus aculeatus aculeatus]